MTREDTTVRPLVVVSPYSVRVGSVGVRLHPIPTHLVGNIPVYPGLYRYVRFLPHMGGEPLSEPSPLGLLASLWRQMPTWYVLFAPVCPVVCPSVSGLGWFVPV